MTLTRNGRLTHNQVVAGSSPAARVRFRELLFGGKDSLQRNSVVILGQVVYLTTSLTTSSKSGNTTYVLKLDYVRQFLPYSDPGLYVESVKDTYAI